MKFFGKGLGLPTKPFSPGRQSSNVHENGSTVTVNGAGISEQGADASTQPVNSPYTLPTQPLPNLPAPLGTVADRLPRNGIVIVPTTNPQVTSSISVRAPYETLFNDFNFVCKPFYNFWVNDELTNDTEALGLRQLSDVPRYIRLNWSVAPVLPNPNVLPFAGSAKYRSSVPVKFSAPTDGVSYTVKGIPFSPDHLQPTNFSDVVKSVINGHLAPGVINSQIELPLANAGLDPSASKPDPLQYTDEDQFLTSEAALGIPINSLRSLILQRASGLFGAASISADDGVSAGSAADRSEFFDGKFSVALPLTDSGQLEIRSTANSPALSFVAQIAENSEPNQVDQVLDLAGSVQAPANSSTVVRSHFVRGKFVNSSVAGVVSEAKVKSMSKPEHVEVMTALAQVLPNLEAMVRSGVQGAARKISMPSFKSPQQVVPAAYVGYVIEKYERDASGIFKKADQFYLGAQNYSDFIDTKVLYGEIYRYRIRCVYRWTYPAAQQPVGTPTNPLATQSSTYLYSEWSPWIYGVLLDQQPDAPPDEMNCVPQSPHQRIIVTVKVPYNPKMDLFKIQLFRKLQNSSGQDVTNWKQLQVYESQDPADFGPNNCLYIDTDVDFVENNGIRYVYSAISCTRHGGASALTEQIGCSLTKDWQSKGEIPAVLISGAGVQITDFAPFHVYPMKRDVQERKMSTSQTVNGFELRFVLSGRNATGNNSMTPSFYIVRVQSLDTGQSFDDRVSLSYNNLPVKTRQVDNQSYVLQHNLNMPRSPTVVNPGASVPITTPLPPRGADVEKVKSPKSGYRPPRR